MKISAAAKIAITATVLALAGCNQSLPPAPQPSASSSVVAEPDVKGPEVHILAFGDSLFAGYGLASTDDAYPARLERALRARGINARVSNAGVSGNTTGDGLQRLKFTLDNQTAPPQLAIISLGGNDMLRGLPPTQAKANLDAILAAFETRKIPVVVMGMLAAPNLGEQYARDFNAMFPDVTNAHHAVLVPFFLAPVIDKPALVQADHIHPTAKGVDVIVSATVDTVVKALGK